MTRALLVIDVQESFRASERWQTIENPRIAESVARLVEHVRTEGDPVYWILHSEPGSAGVFDPESGWVRPLAELSPASGEPVIVKTTINAFTSTDLEQRLRAAGIDELTVCGIRTEQCVETTTRLAADLGFAVTFVVDATTTNPAGELSAREVIERTTAVLTARGFAEVVTLAELIG